MPLVKLSLHQLMIDLTPLEGMNIEAIEFHPELTKSRRAMQVLRGMKSLKRIFVLDAGEFWKKLDAKESNK